MKMNDVVGFDWQGSQLEGSIEKEYENTYLINVLNPSKEITNKYLGRLVVSKKNLTY